MCMYIPYMCVHVCMHIHAYNIRKPRMYGYVSPIGHSEILTAGDSWKQIRTICIH